MRGSVPIYWDESDRVAFDVGTGKSKSRAALDRKERSWEKKKPAEKDGVYFYPIPRAIDGGMLPTREEWIAEKQAKQGRPEGPGAR
jgi:hypothetical protein